MTTIPWLNEKFIEQKLVWADGTRLRILQMPSLMRPATYRRLRCLANAGCDKFSICRQRYAVQAEHGSKSIHKFIHIREERAWFQSIPDSALSSNWSFA